MNQRCHRINQRVSFFLSGAFLLLIGMFILANHLTTYRIVIPDIYYLVFTGLILLLDAIIFFFMFFQFICNRKLLYVAILGLGFLGSDIYCSEALTLIQRFISMCIPMNAITNDLAIFYLFRQITFIVAILFALYYAYLLSKNISPDGKDEALAILLAFAIFFLAIFAHNLSSYNPQISLNLINKANGHDRNAWSSHYGALIVAAWFMVLLLVIVTTALRNLLWVSISAFCISSIFSNLILLNLNEYNFSVWYLSRGIEVVCTFFVIIVLLYDIFLMHKNSTMLSIHDPLTGIYNRAYFYKELQQRVASRDDISVMILDIDHFKRINDRYGHPVGDSVIRCVVELARSAIRENDVLARIGGEEFAVLMYNASPQVAQIVAERIRSRIAIETEKNVPQLTPEPMTVSIGVFTSSDKRFTADERISFADKALYVAKRSGRNRVVVSE
ncbi:TPA: GGDEF domain-containing protein [Kluyvera ascorbata F0526]|nr:GGDEF domain-containing protein [Kluyvera ascorbata F0526]